MRTNSSSRRQRFSARSHAIAERRRAQYAQVASGAPTRNEGGTGPVCPESAEHGQLRVWPSSGGTVYYCADDRHTGFMFFRAKALQS